MMLYSERSQAPSTKSPHTDLSSTGDEEVGEKNMGRRRRSVFIVAFSPPDYEIREIGGRADYVMIVQKQDALTQH